VISRNTALGHRELAEKLKISTTFLQDYLSGIAITLLAAKSDGVGDISRLPNREQLRKMRWQAPMKIVHRHWRQSFAARSGDVRAADGASCYTAT
jgi:hypothetical protein